MASTISAVNEGSIHAYLDKPWDDAQLLHVVCGAVDRKRLVDERNALLALTARQNEELNFLNDGLEDAVRARTSELKQSSTFLELSNQKLKESFLATLGVFSNLVELRHQHTGAMASGWRICHARSPSVWVCASRRLTITVAGLLHDIGKIGWTDDMIDKPFNVAFTIEERQLAMKHPCYCRKMLMELENMRGAARIIRHHLRRFNVRLPGRVVRLGHTHRTPRSGYGR